MSVRVLIVDDDELMRAGLRSVLASDERIDVVDEAADGRSAIDRARHHQPDVVLIDIRMPVLDGIAATPPLLAAAPGSRVVVLTTFDDDEHIFGALKAGASGFLLKRSSPKELIAATHTAAAGDALLSPSVTRRVVDRLAHQPLIGPTDKLDELTTRERDVLELIATGLSNREITARLAIEETTVKSHAKRIPMKLGLRDRAQAVIHAYETGLARAGR